MAAGAIDNGAVQTQLRPTLAAVLADSATRIVMIHDSVADTGLGRVDAFADLVEQCRQTLETTRK